jgi:hypothetical protein
MQIQQRHLIVVPSLSATGRRPVAGSHAPENRIQPTVIELNLIRCRLRTKGFEPSGDSTHRETLRRQAPGMPWHSF